MEQNVEDKLTLILNQAARDLNLSDYFLNLNSNPQKGDGFLGEVFKASILDEITNTTIHLIVKKAPSDQKRRDETCIEKAYENEIHFYKEIMPALRKFQQDRQILKPFDHVPRYITSINDIGKEIMVFQDITFLGYQMRDKDFILDEEHAELIFQTYGKYHALSFCFKNQNPEEYKRLTKSCYNILKEMTKKGGLPRAINRVAKQSLETLQKSGEIAVAEKFQIYAEKTVELFENCINYEGNYSAILHGDCWSNNMMFKYQDAENKTKLESINLLDFQLVWTGSPVYDLSYFFYSGGTAKLYEKLNYYLDLYHQSFSEFSRKLGCDPEILLPRVVLTQEWKKYAIFGMLMSLVLTKVKLLTKEQSIEVAESIGGGTNGNFLQSHIKDDIFNERIKNLLVHMYKINAL